MRLDFALLLLACSVALGCGASASNSAASGGAAGSAAMAGTAAGTAGSGNETAGQGGAGSSLTPPADDRPARPAWDPPIPLGSSGWEDSTEPLCEPHQGSTQVFSVWADARGVSAFFSADCNPLAEQVCTGSKGSALQFNDGTGWKWLYQAGTIVPQLSGLPGKAIVLTGVLDGRSGIFLLEDGKLTLSHPLEDASQTKVFGVGPELAYATVGAEVMRYRAGQWDLLQALPEQPLALWADEQTLAVVGGNQTFLVKDGNSGKLTQLADTPAGTYTAVWGFGADDLWAGNSEGQLVHYDGAAWTTIETGSQDSTGSGITGLWGDSGVVYFTTFTEFGRVDARGVELLYARDRGASPSEPYFSPQSLWGRSATEVFLTLSDERFEQYACGSAFIVWFDGKEFHQF
jgi:hypothetical protein